MRTFHPLDGAGDSGLRQFLVLGPVLGLTLGIVARAWMRWISLDHEFTWAGTIAIIVAFTLFATSQAAARAVRERSSSPRKTAMARLAAGVLSLGLFSAAGSVMLPTVVFGSIALWQSGRSHLTRTLLVVPALPGAAFVANSIVTDHGWSPSTIGMILVFAGIYAVVILATAPTAAPVDGGWRPSRLALIVVGALGASGLGAALYFGGIE